jgi:hypothetical protein
MSCGAGIPADATKCEQCGVDFARPPAPAPPSNGDPSTVAMHEVATPDPAPFVSARGTVPLKDADIPPDERPTGEIADEQSATAVHEIEPAVEERGPDSGTMVMDHILAERAAQGPEPQPAPQRADPYAKTVAGGEGAEAVSALRAARDAADRPKPQHYSLPPGAVSDEPLPKTGEYATQESLPDLAQPPAPRATAEMAMPPPHTHEPSSAERGEAAMSMVAGTAKIVSDAFNSGFGQTLPGWKTEVAAPAGLSTEGGKHALMPITVVNAAAQRIAIGHADVANRLVTLKTYRSIIRSYARRYDRGWDVNPEQYAALVETISSFFVAMQFDFGTEEDMASYPPRPSLGLTGSHRKAWIFIAVWAAFALALGIYALVR